MASLALSLSVAAAAQAPSPAAPAPAYGTSSVSHVHIGYGEFASETSANTYSYSPATDHIGRTANTPDEGFDAHLHLPTGARLVSLRVDFCDSNPTLHLHFNLLECDVLGGNCNNFASVASAQPAVGNCGSLSTDLTSADYTVQNETRQLILVSNLSASDASNVLLGADIGYSLQVSPAPAVATFTDVPTTHPQFKFVEALVAAGITAGCGGGNYCPTAPITRGQMAVFLATALGLHFPD